MLQVVARVLFLQKRLIRRPRLVQAETEITVRTYAAGDVGHWLRLQAASMPASQAGRLWTEDDFAREFSSRSWWSSDRMLFAITGSERVLGTVTLGHRGTSQDRVTADRSSDRTEATIHWLLVDPQFQRRGIATCLVSQLEQLCWDRGGRTISLETLSCWTAAVAFYRAREYEFVDKSRRESRISLRRE